MYLVLIFLPLIGSFISGFFGRYLGSFWAAYIATGSVFVSCCFSFFVFYEVALSMSPVYLKLFNWIESEMLVVNLGFIFDSLTCIMLLVVTIVSLLVHIYSLSYMECDPHLPRFMSYLSLFTFFMLMLVTADNFIQMFFGWEGVGLASYLLINFWFTRLQANKSAIKAMLVNRIGDFGLTLGILLIYILFQTLDYCSVFSLVPFLSQATLQILNYDLNLLNLICLFLFVGAVGKSAQLWLHTWLPDAMEGPTPVSALIHAATMVTAGVFLIVRCSVMFEYSVNALLVITIIGALTAFFAATVGLVQNDLKRVIAYSTCSQLGYMIFACGLSSYSVSMFHLMNHAFFKALLFLGAGSIIHSLIDEQDIRKMGGLINFIPFTYIMMLIGSLALMGFPFLTGFYSKDLILEISYATYTISSRFSYWLGTISAFCTAFYSFRLIYFTFLTRTNIYLTVLKKCHDAPFLLAFPLIFLGLGSIFVGYLTKDMLVGLGSAFWGSSIFVHPEHLFIIDAEFMTSFMKLIPVLFSIFGAFFALFLNLFYETFIYNLNLTFFGYKSYVFFNKRWFFDIIYNFFVAKRFLSFGYNISFKLFDKGIVELLGPYGIILQVHMISTLFSRYQTGFLYNYVFVLLISAFMLVFLSLDLFIFNFDLKLLSIFFVLLIS